LVRNSDVFGMRVIVITPDRYRTPDVTQSTDELNDSRYGHTVKSYYTQTGEVWKILGEFPVRNANGTPDPSGEQDTSFLAKVPANTPILLQGIDSRGMTVFTEQTWRHIAPGQTIADCGGCHAHSIQPVHFAGKAADSAGYQPVDLVGGTPMVVNGATQLRGQTGAFGVEFRRDVYPILTAKCASCHTGIPPKDSRTPGGTPQLALFDANPPPATYAGALRTYHALADDQAGKYSNGTRVTTSGSFSDPQVSRYVVEIQARASLLSWKVYGQRLDGRLDGTGNQPDFGSFPAGQQCLASSALTDAEKGTITRWIDLGCPLDLDPAFHTKEKYTDDHLVPVVTVAPFLDNTGSVSLRVGAIDLESGLDLGSDATVHVDITVPGAAAIHLVTSSFAWDAANAVGTAATNLNPAQFSPSSPLTITAVVTDRAGNSEREDLVVGQLP
jgi:hypothetical protein